MPFFPLVAADPAQSEIVSLATVRFARFRLDCHPRYMSRKFESFERINSMRETDRSFDACNRPKRLGTGRLHELHESKHPFVSRIEFIHSKLSNFSAHVSGVRVCSALRPRPIPREPRRFWTNGHHASPPPPPPRPRCPEPRPMRPAAS